MSDDPHAKPLEHPRTPANILAHWCSHPGCEKWGGWGFARGKETVWFCYEHRAGGEA